MNPIEFANKYFGEYKVHGEEIIPTYCPFCHGGSKHQKFTFALNINKMTYNCKRANKCNVSGTFWQLCNHFGEKADSQVEWENEHSYRPKQYKKPKVHAKAPGSKIEEYFKNRAISMETYKRRKIGESDKGAIMLPYFENGELVLVKYRTPEKPSKHWREAGGKPVFWGMDFCKFDKPLVITEGEMDALALDECGIPNVVSVPSGAEDLECITNNWDFLQQFSKIIIWGDNDEAGSKMINKLITRLGSERCYLVHSKYKDANEHLINEGKESVINCFQEHKEVPVMYINKLAEAKVFDPTKVKTIKTGIYGIDKTSGGLLLGHVSIVSGKNGSGKSTVLNQFIANAVEQGYKSCIYSGELESGLLRYWVELPMAGPRYISERKNGHDLPVSYYISEDIRKKIRDWYQDYVFYYDNTQSTKPKDILAKFEETYKRYGCKLFIIDNLMTMSFRGNEFEIQQSQSEFVGECVSFAQKYETHIVIVQHPIKVVDKRITKDDIRGTGDITNRVGAVFLVHRLTKAEKTKLTQPFDTAIEIAKNRYNGKVDVEVELQFDKKSKRFYGESDDLNKQYSWNKSLDEFYEIEIKFPWDEEEQK